MKRIRSAPAEQPISPAPAPPRASRRVDASGPSGPVPGGDVESDPEDWPAWTDNFYWTPSPRVAD